MDDRERDAIRRRALNKQVVLTITNIDTGSRSPEYTVSVKQANAIVSTMSDIRQDGQWFVVEVRDVD